MELIPLRQVTAIAGSYIAEMQVASDPANIINTAITDAELQRAVDYKSVSGNNYYKKYINLGKFYANLGFKWKDAGDYYPDASTIFRIAAGGYGDGDIVARIKLTWYCAFRSYSTV